MADAAVLRDVIGRGATVALVGPVPPALRHAAVEAAGETGLVLWVDREAAGDSGDAPVARVRAVPAAVPVRSHAADVALLVSPPDEEIAAAECRRMLAPAGVVLALGSEGRVAALARALAAAGFRAVTVAPAGRPRYIRARAPR
jgi:hypothetical protein